VDLTGMALLGVRALAPMLGISYLGEADASASSPLSAAPVIAGLLGPALFGIAVITCLPVIARVPEHRGSW
jgi:hypothetical protein